MKDAIVISVTAPGRRWRYTVSQRTVWIVLLALAAMGLGSMLHATTGGC